MQKLRIQNAWDNSTKSFIKTEFKIKDFGKVIAGTVSVSSKQDDKYISSSIDFVAFKSKISEDTQRALLESKGELFEAEFGLMANHYINKKGDEVKAIKIVINEAKFQGALNNSPQEIEDDEINF